MLNAETIRAVHEWIAQDPDETTKAALVDQLERANAGDSDAVAELEHTFATRLQFGTAGLRGALGYGPSRMNRVTVAQAAAGFSHYLRNSATPGNRPRLVIGYDGRHNSHRFAVDTAEIATGAGIEALLLPRALPTPLLAFAVRWLHADGGVMVTASHNPAPDNGYKVYLGGKDDGAQIIPPTDSAIAADIDAVARGDIRELPRSDEYTIAAEHVVNAYIDACVIAAPRGPGGNTKVVYTAMHGVGWSIAKEVFARAGFTEPHVVIEQRDPDPDFPTAPFPNPEEPGALDLAFALAAKVDADLVIANDPDADRLAIGLPTGDGGWRRLTGNEVGSLFGHLIATDASSTRATTNHPNGVFANSLVSSPQLGVIAKQHGIEHRETLTGFKYIGRQPGLVFGYEEALGYLVNPRAVHDKDGISAAAKLWAYAETLAEQGRTLTDVLHDIDRAYGAYASSQLSIRNDDKTVLDALVASVRQQQPASIGPFAVDRWDDFLNGFGDFPPQNILRAHLAGGARVIFRPSGTEPKLKVYIDARGDTHDAAVARVAELEAAVRDTIGINAASKGVSALGE